MKSFPVVVSAAFLLLANCIARAESTSTDEIFAQRLLGTWEATGIEKTFYKDGTSTGAIWMSHDPEGSRVTFKTDWRIENGYLIGVVRECSEPEALPIGFTYRDQIISISDTEYIFIDEEGERQIRKRKKVESPSSSEKSD